MLSHITSAQNTTLKRLRALSHKKYRERDNLFLAEGLRICTEALQSGWTPEILLFAEGKAAHPLVARLVDQTLRDGGQVIETTAELLGSISHKDNPQQVVAAYRPRLLTLETLVPGRCTLVAERLRDPGNLGTLLRSCDATGTGALILVDECTDPLSPEAVRASMGAFFTVPTVKASTAELLAFRARHKATLVGAALAPQTTDYRAFSYPAPTLILLGNEAQGLPETLLSACDALVGIPMLGRADSLNVAMAGTLLLYEALRASSSLSRPAQKDDSIARH